MTLTNTVFIGTAAFVTTVLHGCGSKDEKDGKKDGETTTTPPPSGSGAKVGSSGSPSKEQLQAIQSAVESKSLDAAQAALKAANLNIQQLEAQNKDLAKRFQDLQAQAAKDKADKVKAEQEAREAREAGRQSDGGEEDEDFAEMDAKYEQAFEKYCSQIGKSKEDLNDDDVAAFGDYLDEHEEDFKEHLDARKQKGLDNAEKIAEVMDYLSQLEGDDAADKQLRRILQPMADMKQKKIEELVPDDFTAKDYAEISRKLEDHYKDFSEALERADTGAEVKDGLKKAVQDAQAFDKWQEENLEGLKSDDLEIEDLNDLAGDLQKQDVDLTPHLQAAAKSTDNGSAALLNKIAALADLQNADEESVKKDLTQFQSQIQEKFGKPLDQLEPEKIAEMASQVGQVEKLNQLKKAADSGDEAAAAKLQAAIQELEHKNPELAKQRQMLMRQVEQEKQAREAKRAQAKPHTNTGASSGEPKSKSNASKSKKTNGNTIGF